MNSIIDMDNKQCYGCESCAAHCPKHAITMQANQEGFLYPFVDESLCVGCGKCLEFCPIGATDNVRQTNHNISVVALSLKDQSELKKSSSGGAAYALMSSAIEQGYVVFGVAYDEDFKGCHYQSAQSFADIENFRGTKYIQARKKELYDTVRQLVRNGEKVMFIGLPCEVAALKLSMSNDLDSIVLVELACHGVTSPEVESQYVAKLEKKYGVISSFTIRDKKYGWTPPCIKAKFIDSKEYSALFDSTEYGYAFRNMSRNSCYLCEYKGNNRAADITIADYWGIENGDSCWNDYGVSAVFVHSEKGEKLLNSVTVEVSVTPIRYENAINRNSYINKPREIGNREMYANSFSKKGLYVARRENETVKEKAIRILRTIYYKFK